LIDEVHTPWPCFVVAARKDVVLKHNELLSKMCSVAHVKAGEIKKNENTAEVISWRYNLSLDQVRSWLRDTEWNNATLNLETAFEVVMASLLKFGIVSEEETENWKKRIF
jgi:hypothetical protein